MTGEQWAESRDPRRMYTLAKLLVNLRLKKARRKLRLYACACCRQVWPLLGAEARSAVEASERFADGEAAKDELLAANKAARRAVPRRPPAAEERPHAAAREAAHAAVRASSAIRISTMAWSAAMLARRAAGYSAEASRAAFLKHGSQQCDLLRDLFGNALRHTTILPSWQSWRDGTLVKMAQAVYDDRRFSDLPIVADALEESGCSDSEMLTHLRGAGLHVRGCWCLDLLLGKE
jgi:hypothetical protein